MAYRMTPLTITGVTLKDIFFCFQSFKLSYLGKLKYNIY